MSLHNPLTSDSTRLRIEVYGREFPNQRSVPMLAAPVRALKALVRRLAFVQAELPALAHSVGLASCRAETKLRYSEGNLGSISTLVPGGSFQPHMDMQALTLLVPLSSAGLDYEEEVPRSMLRTHNLGTQLEARFQPSRCFARKQVMRCCGMARSFMLGQRSRRVAVLFLSPALRHAISHRKKTPRLIRYRQLCLPVCTLQYDISS